MKRRVEGRFEVRRDATTNLPADIQKKILGGMKDPSPAGWEELNREYFERLAGGEGGKGGKIGGEAGGEIGGEAAREKVKMKIAISNFRFAVCLSLLILLLFVSVPAFAAEAKKVVIPFDFVSKFDDGRYGRMLGEMVWKKLSREGGFTIPESMLDVRDYCESHKLAPSPETALDDMAKIVRDDFDAQIGIWGSVERAAGSEGEIYDLVIRCVDFSARPRPKTIYEIKARTKSASEIPHLYVKQMLDALHGRKPGGPPPADLAAEENWKKKPNLVAGDFEHGADGVPRGWDRAPASSASRSADWSAGWPTRIAPTTRSFASHSTRTSPKTKASCTTAISFPSKKGRRIAFNAAGASTTPT